MSERLSPVRLVEPEGARAMRKLVGLTQREVAQLAGCCTATYKRFERGCETGLTTRIAFTLVVVHLASLSRSGQL